jgi:hypothetical protein
MSNLPFVLTFLYEATKYGSKGYGFLFGIFISVPKCTLLLTLWRKVACVVVAYSSSSLKSLTEFLEYKNGWLASLSFWIVCEIDA